MARETGLKLASIAGFQSKLTVAVESILEPDQYDVWQQIK